MHKIHVDEMLISQINRGVSGLTLYENGKSLEIPNSQHQYIETLGMGRNSHWGNFIFFSSSDNLNPTDTDKIYEIKSHDLPLHYFESLSIFHTIEHVDDPIQFLSDHKKFLKPGARVYLSTPNYAAKDRLESLETEDNQIQINGKRIAKL